MKIRIDRNPVATREFVLNLKNFEVRDPLKEDRTELIEDYGGIETFKVLDFSPFEIAVPAIRVYGKRKNRFEFPSPEVDNEYNFYTMNKYYYYTFSEFDQENGWRISEKYPFILRVKTILDYESSELIRVFKNKLQIEIYDIGNSHKPIDKLIFDPIEGINEKIIIKNLSEEFFIDFSKEFLIRLYKQGGVYDTIYIDYFVTDWSSKLFRVYSIKDKFQDSIFIIRKDLPILFKFHKSLSLLNDEDFNLLRKYGIYCKKCCKQIIVFRFEDSDKLICFPSKKLISHVAEKFNIKLESIVEHEFVQSFNIYEFNPNNFKHEFLKRLIDDVLSYSEDKKEFISKEKVLNSINLDKLENLEIKEEEYLSDEERAIKIIKELLCK